MIAWVLRFALFGIGNQDQELFSNIHDDFYEWHLISSISQVPYLLKRDSKIRSSAQGLYANDKRYRYFRW
jgi:hypothetical protein